MQGDPEILELLNETLTAELTAINQYFIHAKMRSNWGFTKLAEVARKHPQAIVCLLSALRVHDLTTQSPFEVWLAIPNKARAPKMDYPPLRIVRCTTCRITRL